MRRRRAGPGPGRCGSSRTARGTRGCPRPGRPDPEWEGPVSATGPRIWPAWPPTAAAALGAKEENAEALQCQPSAPKLWLLLSPDHEPLEPDEDRACQGDLCASAGILEFLQTPNTTHSVCIHVPTPPGLGSLTFPHLLCLWVPHSLEDCYSLITDLYNPCNTALTGCGSCPIPRSGMGVGGSHTGPGSSPSGAWRKDQGSDHTATSKQSGEHHQGAEGRRRKQRSALPAMRTREHRQRGCCCHQAFAQRTFQPPG
ncbi:uncharacterized protein LOC113983696 isoform X1 [Pipra filicauda]|uniref:Uncharacterized protein LOC113983696 isoform X1 n=1 Tax=Pipra filicauda TaxID=649802 RepID=A0A7R5KLR9_9PASS|nr:uncharacterized protein LOC113983696 isoform X1 [Pipra filicauda]